MYLYKLFLLDGFLLNYIVQNNLRQFFKLFIFMLVKILISFILKIKKKIKEKVREQRCECVWFVMRQKSKWNREEIWVKTYVRKRKRVRVNNLKIKRRKLDKYIILLLKLLK